MNVTMSKTIPFSEPPWLTGLPSPYYTASHRAFQSAARAFITEHLHAHALEWENLESVPDSVFQTFAASNMLLPNLPSPLPISWLHSLGISSILGVPIAEWDYLHTLIYVDELNRSGLVGPPAAITAGFAFGLPPLLHFGSQTLHQKFLPDLLTGKKRICIAITEPGTGSDVAGIETVAEESADGKSYVVNGSKKWITNGIWCDYAAMAVRTGASNSGARGLSMLVVPLKGQDGVTMRKIDTGGSKSSGTTFIELEDVHVPAENLIGKEGQGMSIIMTNFNHERLTIAIGATRQARVALSSAFEYCLQREAFGKPLMELGVVRHRLAKAGALLESQWAWIEQFCYQMTRMEKPQADKELGGLTALCKAQAGMVLDECARCAVLLFGGNGYTRTGKGELVQKLYSEVPGARVPGGSEDVLLDLAVRQLVKNFQNATKGLQRPSASSKL